ncbi:MAG: hypothetical protein B6240_04975, partial [Desulfobacteraceae bacterium 4572_87]
GLGFGLQNIVNNFIGGLILLFGRSIQPGDLVEIDDRYADSEVRYHIDRIFRENNIEISFPQLDLHIRSAKGLENLHGATPGNHDGERRI